MPIWLAFWPAVRRLGRVAGVQRHTESPCYSNGGVLPKSEAAGRWGAAKFARIHLALNSECAVLGGEPQITTESGRVDDDKLPPCSTFKSVDGV